VLQHLPAFHINVTLASQVVNPIVPMLALVVVVLTAPLLLLTPTVGCMGPVPIPAPSVTHSYLVIRVVLPLPICKELVQATAIGFQLDILGLLYGIL
jgi:hypothetical protein